MNTAAPAPKRGMSTLAIVAASVGCLVLVVLVAGGIFAALGLRAYKRFVTRSKQAEAEMNLKSLARSEMRYCTDMAEVTRGGGVQTAYVRQAGPLPSLPSARRQIADFASAPGFRELGFDPGTEVYFTYEISPHATEADGVVLRARGDLDGDGDLSVFELSCHTACGCDPSSTRSGDLED